MNAYRMIQTRGDPLRAIHEFVHAIWQKTNLDAMLVPIDSTLENSATPHIIEDPARLAEVNPFKPLMVANAARFLPGLLRNRHNDHVGVLLRPCEMRALNEMIKRNGFPTERLLTICVDCLGTFPSSDFKWRAERKGSAAGLTQEALQFARQGGIVAYRYRSACQLCTAPDASGAHLNIGVLGLPARQFLLVEARNNATAERLQLETMTDDQADFTLVNQRQRTIARIVERNQRNRERVYASLGELLPADVDALVMQFETCGACQACMNSCPICTVDYPRRNAEGSYLSEDIQRWLVSCAGCGMCEQVCPNHLPLSAIFGHIRQLLA